uniref:Histone acetyltransferase n=1 Tax=Parastrongyloides trichosuri TaxID=131310 RepID=A0A0N4ZZZ3_PARTI
MSGNQSSQLADSEVNTDGTVSAVTSTYCDKAVMPKNNLSMLIVDVNDNKSAAKRIVGKAAKDTDEGKSTVDKESVITPDDIPDKSDVGSCKKGTSSSKEAPLLLEETAEYDADKLIKFEGTTANVGDNITLDRTQSPKEKELESHIKDFLTYFHIHLLYIRLNKFVSSLSFIRNQSFIDILQGRLSDCRNVKIEMLIEPITPKDYDNILQSIEGNPKFLNIYFCIKSEFFKWSPTTKVYGWKIFNDTTYAYAVINIHEHGKHYLIVQIEDDKNNDEFGYEASRLLYNEVQQFFDSGEDTFCVIASNIFMKGFRELFYEKSPYKYKTLDEQVVLFYINEENYKNCIEQPTALPDGFKFERLTPDFAPTMMDQSLYAAPEDVILAGNRLKQFPSVGIIEMLSNNVVSFYYNDGFGFLAHQYTYPEYRKRGFPKFLNIYFCIKSEFFKWSPTTKVYGWKIFNDTTYAYAVINIHETW